MHPPSEPFSKLISKVRDRGKGSENRLLGGEPRDFHRNALLCSVVADLNCEALSAAVFCRNEVIIQIWIDCVGPGKSADIEARVSNRIPMSQNIGVLTANHRTRRGRPDTRSAQYGRRGVQRGNRTLCVHQLRQHHYRKPAQQNSNHHGCFSAVHTKLRTARGPPILPRRPGRSHDFTSQRGAPTTLRTGIAAPFCVESIVGPPATKAAPNRRLKYELTQK
jgi:hypothetical protein